MPRKEIVVPVFHTEADEAEWWDNQPEVATEIMERALKSGKVRRAESGDFDREAIRRPFRAGRRDGGVR